MGNRQWPKTIPAWVNVHRPAYLCFGTVWLRFLNQLFTSSTGTHQKKAQAGTQRGWTSADLLVWPRTQDNQISKVGALGRTQRNQ